MLHSIPEDRHGPLTGAMVRAVDACVHCGFCLAACPTYRELGQEMDTPRGRILLMKQALEGDLSFAAAQPHIDRCLGCLACEPACPSGVPYRDLISPFRAVARTHVKPDLSTRLRQALVAQTIPYPGRFRAAARLGSFAKPLRALLPAKLRPMLELIPSTLPPAAKFPAVNPAQGTRRARVALLAGCAQQVLEPDINRATVEVLTRQGVEVLLPRSQGCCGGLAWHTGDLPAAQAFARRNLDAFPADVDAILTNAAGCGSALHEYPLVLRGTPDEARATAFAPRVQDVSVFLTQLGWREAPPDRGRRQTVVYHDACHLANAQNVRQQPRALLRSIPGLELRELAEPHFCCGSAGSYNIDQPEIAASLGRQKAQAIIDSGAECVATGNIGCLTQLQLHLRQLASPIRVRHTLQVVRDAFVAP